MLKQLNADVVRLVNTLPDVDRANKAMIERLIGHGGLLRAQGLTGSFERAFTCHRNSSSGNPVRF